MILEFLGKLGVDVNLLLAQIINFGLLVLLLKKFLYIPIIKRIEKDEAKLKEAQTQKDALEKERQEFESYKSKTVDSAHEKAESIIREAEDVAKNIKERYEMQAKKEKEKVVEQIHERLTEMKSQTKNENKE